MSTRPDGKIPVQVLLEPSEHKMFEKFVIERLKGKAGKSASKGFGPVIRDFAIEHARQLRATRQQPQEG